MFRKLFHPVQFWLAKRWPRRAARLFYIVPAKNWVLDWVGRYITRNVQRQFGMAARTRPQPPITAGDLLHYGSLGDFLTHRQHPANAHNAVVVTVFHGQRGDPERPYSQHLEELLAHQAEFQRLVTASRIMEDRFLEWGIPPEKLVCIPLGVDLGRFRPASPQEKAEKRRALGIPEETFVVGSFHKDGQGWGDGEEPKPIKGPDILLETAAQLKGHLPLFFYLTAPARSYVKNGLDRLGIPYRHDILEDYHAIPACYHALDAYLVPSREEGGPEGVLEALASGVPLVSTRVGLAPDVVTDGQDGLLAEVEDAAALAAHLAALAADPALGGRLAAAGLHTIQAYDWPKIAARYYHEVYAPLLGLEPAP